MSPLLPYLEEAIAALTILGILYGFYSGWLPDWLKRMVGHYELRDDIREVKDDTNELRKDHEDTMNELVTLKHGQLAIAEAVDNEHESVRVAALREEHFRGDARADDFLRGPGGSPGTDD